MPWLWRLSRPQNATPLPNGGALIPTFDGGYALMGPGMTSQGIVYFDQNGDPTMDRAKAYLPAATAQLNAMAGVPMGGGFIEQMRRMTPGAQLTA